MINQRISLRIVLSVLISVFFFSLPAYGTVWYVDGDASAGGDGSSWSEAFDDIQTAINAATGLYNVCFAPLDQIWVKEDVYHLSSQIQVNKIVTILGGFDGTETESSQRDWENNPTVIDGDESVRCLYITHLCQINGFTIRDGRVNSGSGAGIYIEDGVEYCFIIDAYFSPSITNCELINNTASVAGGGIYITASDPRITNCRFVFNFAPTGGAIYHVSSSPTIEKSRFNYNASTAPGSLGGGAIGGYSRNFTTEKLITITNCLFYNNAAGSWGGAISYNQVYPTITNCSFFSNDADLAGGAFHGNTNSEAPKIRNSIFWGDNPDELDITTASSYLDVSYSDIEGGWTGPGTANINANPLYTGGSELHITPETSPCIDSGSNFYAPDDDIAGVDRPIDGDGNGTATSDMGAWEEAGPASPVDDIAGLPTYLDLRNQPNPFNPRTTIAFDLPREMRVSLRIYNVSGLLVDVLIDDQVAQQGGNEVVWHGRDLAGRVTPAGVYFYRLEADGFIETKRMTLLK